MSLKTSEAVILRTFNWSESSRTVVFFSRDFGKLPLIDKGGRRFNSKRGKLMPFARMEVTFYDSEKESNGYLSDSDLIEAHLFDKDGTLGRLAYGSGACELLYLLLPDEEPQPALYTYLISFFQYVNTADKHALPALFLIFFLRLLSQLGYHPSLSYCTGCGRPPDVNNAVDQILLSPKRGGIVCRACQTAGERYIPLSVDGFATLQRLQTSSLDEASLLPIKYTDAAALTGALAKFLSYQAEVNSDLKSLEFLEKLRTSQLDSEKDSHGREKS